MLILNAILIAIYCIICGHEKSYLMVEMDKIDDPVLSFFGVIIYAFVFICFMLSSIFGTVVLGVLVYDAIVNNRRLL